MHKRRSKQTRTRKLVLAIGLLATISSASQAAVRADDLPTGNDTTNNTIDPDISSASIPEIKPGKQPLVGGVQHSEQLPSLGDTLKPGKVYSDQALLNGNIAGNDIWYQIPAWYAGTRHTEYVTIVYRHNFETGQTTAPMQRKLERQDTTAGFMKDKNGGIWDFKHEPSLHSVESDNENAILYLKKVTPVSMTDDQFVIKYQETSISTSKKNGKIIKALQQEQINTVTSPQPGILRMDISVRAFDSDGQPLLEEQSVGFVRVVAPFQERDTFEGRDLKPLFKEYLLLKHLDNLVPDELK
jgi:hypothetical protein